MILIGLHSHPDPTSLGQAIGADAASLAQLKRVEVRWGRVEWNGCIGLDRRAAMLRYHFSENIAPPAFSSEKPTDVAEDSLLQSPFRLFPANYPIEGV